MYHNCLLILKMALIISLTSCSIGGLTDKITRAGVMDEEATLTPQSILCGKDGDISIKVTNYSTNNGYYTLQQFQPMVRHLLLNSANITTYLKKQNWDKPALSNLSINWQDLPQYQLIDHTFPYDFFGPDIDVHEPPTWLKSLDTNAKEFQLDEPVPFKIESKIICLNFTGDKNIYLHQKKIKWWVYPAYPPAFAIDGAVFTVVMPVALVLIPFQLK